jgi:hypothetical protein
MMMAEEEWMLCSDPGRMLAALISYHPLGPLYRGLNPRSSWVDPRRARLFMAACCRSFLPVASDENVRRAVEAAELYVEGLASRQDLADAARKASAASALPGRLAATACATDPTMAATFIVEGILSQQPDAGPRLVSLLRDIFSPFHWPAIAPRYRTREVLELADMIYREPAYHQLPTLADALKRVGFRDAKTLGHCLWSGPHTRGCWAVDAVLAKE